MLTVPALPSWLYLSLIVHFIKHSQNTGHKGIKCTGQEKNGNDWRRSTGKSDLCLRYHVNGIKCRWWHKGQLDAFFLESPLGGRWWGVFLLYIWPHLESVRLRFCCWDCIWWGGKNIIQIMDMRQKFKEITKQKKGVFPFYVKCMYWCPGIHSKKL